MINKQGIQMPGIEIQSLQLCMWLKSSVFGGAFFPPYCILLLVVLVWNNSCFGSSSRSSAVVEVYIISMQW